MTLRWGIETHIICKFDAIDIIGRCMYLINLVSSFLLSNCHRIGEPNGLPNFIIVMIAHFLFVQQARTSLVNSPCPSLSQRPNNLLVYMLILKRMITWGYIFLPPPTEITMIIYSIVEWGESGKALALISNLRKTP